MSYLVLARKWRPMTFEDLVGQEHVSRTLSNAIVSGRIAHAFLFTGVRGVGKTTSARILAKSLNCEAGPTPTPCLKCSACKEIAASNDIDVQEIDGASYNGVDEVRKLQESLPYRPSRDRFKVVIVDEVHMLTQSAWNAFLKTLEEPPPHVKFIFATTEAHKVPVTILSRCQRYDFKLITAAAIAKRIRFVLEQEKIEADEAAIGLMAREAAGSMRDAMSLLDQAMAWGGEKLVGEEIARVLGIAGRSVLLDLADALIEGDASRVLMVVKLLADQGFDLVQVARDTLEVLRDLVVVKVCKDPASLTELTGEELTRVGAMVGKTSVDDLMRLHLGFSRGFDQVVHAPQQRSALEMLLVRLAMRPPLLPIDDLVARLDGLDRKLAGRGAAPARGTGARALRLERNVASSATTLRSAEHPDARIGSASSAAAVASAEPVAARAPIEPAPETQTLPAPRPVPEPPPPVSAPVESEEPPTEPFRRTEVASAPMTPPANRPEPEEKQVASVPMAPPANRTPPVVPEEVPAKRLTDPAPTDPDPEILGTWRAILDVVRQKNAGLASVLEHAVPLEINAKALRLAIEEGSFYAERARDEQALDLLTRVVRDHFGASTEVSFSLQDADVTSGRTLYEKDEAARVEREKQARSKLEQHKLVRAAVDGLGARIVRIKLG
jgi:DNA polymerase III subunit gamma/tau